MKILKFAVMTVIALMIIGFVWKGIKLLLFLSIAIGVVYFVYEMMIDRKQLEDTENI